MPVKNLVKKIKSSFLSCEKDFETILKILFVENKPYCNILKKLLVIDAKDCLNNSKYDEIVRKISLHDLIEQGYVKLVPKLTQQEFEDMKSHILISFDNFQASGNPQFRDCVVNISIVSHIDSWDLGDFRLRPLKIAGYIDGLLNENRLSGLGTLHFFQANESVYNEDLVGYTLQYVAVHGSDDYIPDGQTFPYSKDEVAE